MNTYRIYFTIEVLNPYSDYQDQKRLMLLELYKKFKNLKPEKSEIVNQANLMVDYNDLAYRSQDALYVRVTTTTDMAENIKSDPRVYLEALLGDIVSNHFNVAVCAVKLLVTNSVSHDMLIDRYALSAYGNDVFDTLNTSDYNVFSIQEFLAENGVEAMVDGIMRIWNPNGNHYETFVSPADLLDMRQGQVIRKLGICYRDLDQFLMFTVRKVGDWIIFVGDDNLVRYVKETKIL